MNHFSNNRARLADGRAFHKLIARYYEFESEFDSERMLMKANRRRGCSDIFLWVESDHSFAVVIETKWTDWDKLDERGTLARNLAAHRRQLYSYLDGDISIERGFTGPWIDLEKIDRQAALVYPKSPSGDGIKAVIEGELAEWGITAVWFDEPPPLNTDAGRAWAALQTGEIQTNDLNGSLEWQRYLQSIVGN